jgi:excisionase family DNA binding protein
MSMQWLSVEEIAHELNVHPDTVRGWIRTKKLRAFKFGRDYRVKPEDYQKFLDARATTPEDDNDQE